MLARRKLRTLTCPIIPQGQRGLQFAGGDPSIVEESRGPAWSNKYIVKTGGQRRSVGETIQKTGPTARVTNDFSCHFPAIFWPRGAAGRGTKG